MLRDFGPNDTHSNSSYNFPHSKILMPRIVCLSCFFSKCFVTIGPNDTHSIACCMVLYFKNFDALEFFVSRAFFQNAAVTLEKNDTHSNVFVIIFLIQKF